ncbi:recombinase family protein [Amycolatopsis echigonensis]|uniref:Recombinase family protein n=1 Tax=Amycolatopsis echigonensis TaxID=2576905 RepID=A0A8E2B6I2_9PSEU|nr:recombinase family protein [Amycolatopsis echigonensis]MBB2502921.1 recombinase family protein [Amycolatopsis echigonensis]
MTRHVALYLRISKASPDSIEDQELQGREYAARAWPGMPIVIYAEDGFSGEQADLVRPEYERLLSEVDAGHVANIWCAEQYRLERNNVRWFILADRLAEAGIEELHTKRDGIVRIDSEAADIRAVLGAREVRRTKKRVHDKLETAAIRGEAPSAAVFGYDRDMPNKTYVINEVEAAEVRLAAQRVLDGWELDAIALDMTERGITGKRGGVVVGGTVRSMVTNHAVAGLRVYQGQYFGKGNWPCILDQITWRLVRAKLPADGSGAPRPRRYLLTGGLIVCGVCEAALVPSKRYEKAGQVAIYRCPPAKRGGNCCVSGRMANIDSLVLQQLWAHLDRPEFLAHLAELDSSAERERLSTELAGVEAKRVELSREWANGNVSTVEWREARDTMAAKEKQLNSELSALPSPVTPSITTAKDAWPDMKFGEQLEFLRLHIGRVVLNHPKKPCRSFDPDRVSVEFLY